MEENKKKPVDKDKEAVLKGIVGGGALTALGTGAYLIGRAPGKHPEKYVKAAEIYKRKIGLGLDPYKFAKESKKYGKAMTGVGLATLGLAAYKHHKDKKKGQNNDNPEK